MSDTRKREIVLLSVPQVEAPAIAYQSQNRQRQSPRRYDDMIHRLPYVGRCLHVRTWVCRTQLHICIFLCLPWGLVLTSVWSGGEIQSHPEHLPLALIRTLKCRICWIRLVLNKASYRRFYVYMYFIFCSFLIVIPPHPLPACMVYVAEARRGCVGDVLRYVAQPTHRRCLSMQR